MTDMSKGFKIVRVFGATPEEVWAAWTDPDAAAQWWHPYGTSTPREEVEIDARVGGHYTYTMVNDSTGERVVTAGVYLEVTPYERLVFSWGSPGDDPMDTPRITVTLEAVDADTRMTFELRGVEGFKGDNFFYDGWDEALDSLGGYVRTR
ncbi:MAG: SRPBCC domain-containing protein [Thermomicrobiales bacterium]|nr:SRPBCC domain-containing protein [Thermomicrobiales bacterium]